MTYLSFDNYISKARESQTGTVRIDYNDQNETKLVNKGTFGNGLATIFDNIGKAIVSLFGGTPDQTKAQRNEKALTGFKEALAQQFGETIALKALEDKGLNQVNKINGKQIIDVSDHARSLMLDNRQRNNEMLKDCLPIDYHDHKYQGGKFFSGLCKELGYDPDVAKTLTPKRYEAYYDRLITAFNEATEFDSKALTPDESKAIAQQVLKEVVQLDLGGRLDEAQEARQEFVEAGVRLFTDIDQSRSPRRLLESLVSLEQSLSKLATIEGKQGPEALGNLRKEMMRDVMVELNSRDPKVLYHGRDKIFSEGSPVRALVKALDQTQAEGLTPYGEVVGTHLTQLLSTVVVTLSKSIGSHTESSYQDSVKLDGPDHVSSRMVNKAKEVVGSHLETLTEENVQGRPGAMLDDLKRNHVGKFGEDNLPTWHNTEMLKHLEGEVRQYAQQLDIGIRDSVAVFREAITNDEGLPKALKAKLLAGLDGIESGARLSGKLEENEQFQGFNGRDIERFFRTDVPKWDLEQINRGSLSGLHRGFEYVLDTLPGQPNHVPLSVDYVEDLHRRSTENTFGVSLQVGLMRGFGTDEDFEDWEMMSRTAPDLRNGTAELPLAKTSITEDGLQQLRDNQDRLGYVLTDMGDEYRLKFNESTPEMCKEKTGVILQTYEREIEEAEDDDAKLKAIGRAIQDLYCSHMFQDGNTRTSIMLLNRMLLENDLSPSILGDTRPMAKCSLDEFVERIKEGQETFRELKR